jgi:hypothetical protein
VKAVDRRCNVWEMAVGEHCIHDNREWVRCPNIRARMPTLGVVENAVLRPVDNMKERQRFLRGIEVDVIDAPNKEVSRER